PGQATDCYAPAAALGANDPPMHNALGTALDELGRIDLALSSYARALALAASPEIKANFARCVKKIEPPNLDPGLRQLLTRAISAPWTRPGDLANASIKMIRLDPLVGPCIERAAHAWPKRLADNELFGPAGLAALSDDSLLRPLLENAQVCDVAMERFLTTVRRAVLEAALDTIVENNPDDATLAFH